MSRSTPFGRWLAASLLVALLPQGASALEPQATALAGLQATSAIAPRVDFHAGFPRAAHFDVPATGGTPVERAQNFLDAYADLFSIGREEIELHAARTGTVDDLDVVSFYQTYLGRPVFGSSLTVTLGRDPLTGQARVRGSAGALLPPLTGAIDVTPAIGVDEAYAAARGRAGVASAPMASQPELAIYDPRVFRKPGEARLVWRLTLLGGVNQEYLVDAHSAQVAFEHPLERSDSGYEGYDADFEDANGETMANTNCFNPTTIDDDIGSEDGLISEFVNDVEAATTWWAVRDTYGFWHSKGRHSWDDDWDEIVAYVYSGHANASYAHGCGMQFRQGWSSFDVAAHEFGHGVNAYENSLVYQGETGALDESYADVTAASADSADWTLAEDRTSGLGPIRDLSNPPAFGQPDRYSNFLVTSSDFGGVHTNSGIGNKAHFLMSEGGTFNGRSVAGMGRNKMFRVAYGTMKRLWSSSVYADARAQALDAAQLYADNGWFGMTSADVCTVRNAWNAVEVGQGDTDCDGIEDNVDDGDMDGVVDLDDNCDNVMNPTQLDSDNNGLGDACQDSDGDGMADAFDNCPLVPNPYPQWDWDMDGVGNVCDSDVDGDGVGNFIDNCPNDYNPTQADGNGNGEGDACDPDYDGDGVFASDPDNCPFVANADQADADGDGLGDACDDCPGVADNTNAYTAGIPELGIDPQPYQPDSDGDGQPDACDPLDFGSASLDVDGLSYDSSGDISPDGASRTISVDGLAGDVIDLPLPVCDPDAPYASGEKVQIAFSGLRSGVGAFVLDERGQRVAKLSSPLALTGQRGLRFRPDCTRRYRLRLILETGGSDEFGFTAARVVATGPNPWTEGYGGGEPAPEPVADADRDGLADRIDSCPTVGEPTGADPDMDGVGQACDTCSLAANPVFTGSLSNRTLVSGQLDDDADGRGNACDFDYDQAGGVIAAADFNHMKASVGDLVSQSVCGSGAIPLQRCGEFDHDGSGAVINAADFNLLRAAVGKLVSSFPTCASCTSPWSGAPGSPQLVLGKPVCQGPACTYGP